MTAEVVLYREEDEIARVTLNRPEVHNAVNREVMDRLEEIQRQLAESRTVRVVILSGAGRESFCSGGDLKYFATFRTREEALEMSRRMKNILDGFLNGRQVVIGAVNGLALGGGCEMLSACHFRIAAEHARFSFRQAANGLVTGWGGGRRIFQLLGVQRALRYFLTAEEFTARQALEIGFVDQVVPAEELLPVTLAFARRITAHPSAATEAFLQLARLARGSRWEGFTRLEEETFGDLWMGPDFRRWLENYLRGR